ncbi:MULTISPECIES: FimV/HubP family polar landmark protein [unclassified Thioalkalivibrio]|uniref:FimV/HubP family polar landmark protein n=1 Tax=unclassified Thioalkalivibrio TaxID=2621013 RepID=UPI0003748593|nr:MULTISPECIES: FimV/HubP family polar landmark protein [unclassified Thioalkalivibrio]
MSFGEVSLQSHLNQALRAEIPLRGGAAASDSLQVRQASESDYRRSGMNRGSVPGDLNIQVQGQGADRRVVLTTRQAVREPYVGILLEARWDGGRSMREVSLLLDPPDTMPADAAAPVPRETARDAPARRDAPMPREGESYTVRSGDTLYRIVERAGLAGMADQAMLAFLEANPDAFAEQNINTLRAGAELTVPSRSELEQRSASEARAEVQRQTQVWRDGTVTAAREEPEPEEAAEVEPEVEPVPEEDEVVAEDDEAVPEEDEVAAEDDVAAVDEEDEAAVADDRLEIVTELLPETDEGAVAAAESPDLLQEAMLSQRAEMEGMRDEISELREELGERGRLAEISSENMAELEEQLSQLRAERNELMARLDRADAERNAPLHERIMNDPLLLMMAIALVILLLLVLMAFARGGRREMVVEERAAGMPGRADNSRVQASAVEPAGYEAREVDEARSGSTVAGAATAVGGAVTGMAAGAVAGKEDDRDQPVEPDEPEESVGEPVVVSSSGDSSVDDVLAEVDVCLAYGMNDQAEETLTQAIERDPENTRYRLKLVEARVALGDEAGAREAASGLRERMAADDLDTRNQLAELESRIGGAGDVGPGSSSSPADDDEQVPAAEPTPSGDVDARNEIDFSGLELPDVESGADETAKSARQPDEVDSGLSFDFEDSFDRDGVEPSAPEKADEGGDDLNDLSFDIDDSDLPNLDDDGREDTEAGSDIPALDLGDEDTPSAEAETASSAPGDAQPVGADDDNETRLSLAQAYADMGDEEGARELIDEIVASGTEEQKAKAEAIRQQLDGS